MDLEYALLGLICLHQGITGYALNRMIRQSTGYLLSASLSHIYPALGKLHHQGLVSSREILLKNRPTKKVYSITKTGEEKLRLWLEEPIETNLDFKAFSQKMVFSPLMGKETILRHIDREVSFRESLLRNRGHGTAVEVDFLDTEKFNLTRAELLWNSFYLVFQKTEEVRVAWLKEFRQSVEAVLKT